ncbi:RpiB/LacA/LacB family sugar-phosphate isomerase [candidate division WWE3 bacterium]|uniref:RpiB/LacA/LacB family sugar-phosphate isomerase n=1 Tax=candidate division WWE3 bacterium TaxID=2053526 RepID=A0A7X9HI15_UNCKA|nr:RpiB/LacA/LacB family sugar-phosphate isomerase [candidate division WWE3 bacterium]
MIFIASDHGGFKLKSEIIKHLQSKQVDVTDMGPSEYKQDDDYTDYVYPLAHKVAVSPIDNKGILICRNGVGVSMFANKVKGIRAALSWQPEHAASSRNDDNSNILALPADYINVETAKKIVDAWISTPFSNEIRYKRRLEKIDHFEKQI